ncbi:MAG: nucleotide pyrophosphohydrolase [Nitrospirales bacterium]|nr:nucleotide pyrophosphohydrolase [Nitrospirales bacterium]MBA3965953.1 nucleotide pyrophosphohydrolase [Nitrospirales bacterium]
MVNNNVMSALLEFRRNRNWEQFHQPKELAAALTVEASELLEIFQWKSHDEVAHLLKSESRDRVSDEIADVAIILSYLCHDLGIDLNEAVMSKLKKNEAKYPVDKAYGNAKKYNEE